MKLGLYFNTFRSFHLSSPTSYSEEPIFAHYPAFCGGGGAREYYVFINAISLEELLGNISYWEITGLEGKAVGLKTITLVLSPNDHYIFTIRFVYTTCTTVYNAFVINTSMRIDYYC